MGCLGEEPKAEQRRYLSNLGRNNHGKIEGQGYENVLAACR